VRFSHGRKAAHCGMRRGRPRGHALAHCCAVLASANPIGRVCVCVKTQVECEFQFLKKIRVGLGRPPGMRMGGMAAPERDSTVGIPKSEKRTMVSII
jgi:hypothetical protein